MALGNYQAADIDRQLIYAGAHGNLSRKTVQVVVPATATNGQTIDFIRGFRGMNIIDAFLKNTGDSGGTPTIAIGIAQIPGKASTKVDTDALITATALTTGNLLTRMNNAAVLNTALLLDDDYMIQGVIGTADIGTAAVTMELTILYENIGTP